MNAGARSALVACALLFLGGAVFALGQADKVRAESEQDYLYLPNKTILKHFTAGMNPVIADLLWLECVQYTGRELQGEFEFDWIEHMVKTATMLDPNFIELYHYGGMFLASLKGDGDAAIELLEEGARNNPDSWEMPYEIAMVHLLNRSDDPNSKCTAMYYVGMSLTTGTAPGFMQPLYDGLKDQCDSRRSDPCADLQFEAETYQRLFETGEELMQDVARQKMELVQLRKTCCDLDGLVRQYKEHTGALPKDLDELVQQGVIPALPQDPSGGEFFLDSDGTVKNTTVLEDQITRYRSRIQFAVDKYFERYGFYPPSLQGLHDLGGIGYIPQYPYAGRDWEYDEASGKVQ